jgi:hypothetical protein
MDNSDNSDNSALPSCPKLPQVDHLGTDALRLPNRNVKLNLTEIGVTASPENRFSGSEDFVTSGAGLAAGYLFG